MTLYLLILNPLYKILFTIKEGFLNIAESADYYTSKNCHIWQQQKIRAIYNEEYNAKVTKIMNEIEKLKNEKD